MSRGPYPILLILAMALPGAARAIGLGDIRIDSALNEPLSAQIDIVGATKDELAALTASVANREIFQRHGADRPAFLSSATFKVGMDGRGRPTLYVRSKDPFTDPLVSFLVDLRWGKNEVVREYSLLLDPPGYRYTHDPANGALAGGVVAPAAADVPAAAAFAAPSVNSPASASRMSAPVLRRQTRATASAERAGTQPHVYAADSIRVAGGDTLRKIARRAGARNETQAQTLMIALFRANPSAFEGNINRMHRGAVLTIPTAAQLATLSTADARREVRAHMTAWRLDGRPGVPRHALTAAAEVVAAPSVAVNVPAVVTPVPMPVAKPDEPAEASLQTRVQTLEAALTDMHQQLANENARIQDLKQAAVKPQAATAELVQAPILGPLHPVPTTPSIAATTQAPTRSAEIFGPVVVTLGLLVGAFAFVRRRLTRPITARNDVALGDAPAQSPVSAASSPSSAAFIAAAPASPAESMKPTLAEAPAIAPPQRSAAAILDTLAQPMPTAQPESTANLEIDIEALERSYLDSLPVEATLIETSTVETLSVDPSEADTAILDADLNTVLIETKKPAAAPAGKTSVDFDLLDLDATAQHVHMPSGLNDHSVVAERRTSIVDALKMAIERDPERRDLRMKLLETYYSLASTNQRAFMDVVRKLSREKDGFSAEDWQKVSMMGREIAADDILFADLPKDTESLADCA